MAKLLGYNYKIEYKKARENKAANALSRVPELNQVMAITTSIPSWIEEVQQSYLGDNKCQELLTKLNVDNQAQPPYTLQNGIMRYEDRLYVGNSTKLKNQLLESFHASALGGHSGERASYQRLKLLLYWPGMRLEVNNYVKRCPICQKNKLQNVHYPRLLQPIHVSDKA